MEKIAVLVDLQRMLNTPDGNPRWKIETDIGTFFSEPDATFAYGIENGEPIGLTFLLKLTPNGRVEDMTAVPDDSRSA